MTLRWLTGFLLLATVLTGCIVVPAHPVVGRQPHYHPHHRGYDR
jgi:hypothetical protein